MFDENSFDQSSFSVSSWFIDAVQKIVRRIRQWFVRTDRESISVVTASADIVARAASKEIQVVQRVNR